MRTLKVKYTLKFILGFLASAFGMAQAIVMTILQGQNYRKSYLFDDFFHLNDKEKKMIGSLNRPWSYHDLKDVWPTWLETGGQEQQSKFIALVILTLIVITLIETAMLILMFNASH